jgi:hypothetical protein
LINNLVGRAKSILLTPPTEWPVIANRFAVTVSGAAAGIDTGGLKSLKDAGVTPN